MSKKIIGSAAIFVVLVVSLGFVVAEATVPEASAKGKNQFQRDLVVQTDGLLTNKTCDPLVEKCLVEIEKLRRLDISGTVDIVERALAGGNYSVDSFFDIYYVSNIGSSGLDGNTANVTTNLDSFFDIEYLIDGSGAKKGTIPTEMIAMSLTVNLNDPPNAHAAIDIVRKALEKAGGDVIIGHITVLK